MTLLLSFLSRQTQWRAQAAAQLTNSEINAR
jgi:hypothetical protein